MKLKKILSAFLALTMLAGCALFAGSASAAGGNIPFTDVPENKWYYESVKYAYENGLMEGTGGTTFSPLMKLSRAQFVTILGRMAGAEEVETDTFPDVKPNSWYSGYVGWAVEAGIVKGLDNGKFGVNDPVTREMAAVMVDRYVNDYVKCNITTRGGMYDFKDEAKVSKWAADSIAVLRNSGVVEGDQNRNFNPKGNMTRSEAAAIFMRLDLAIENAWQGYLPESDGSKALVYGASYLYWTGSLTAGGMGHDLDTSGEYPVLGARLSRYDATFTYHEANTIGISINYGEIDVKKTPFVKVAYKNGMDGGDTPDTYYVANKTSTEKADPTVNEKLTLSAGSADNGMSTAVIDLSVINKTYPDLDYSRHLANLLFKPCSEDYEGDGTFDILYIAFFETKADAEAFSTSSADDDIVEYLKNYEPYSDLDWREFTADDEEYYDALLEERIAEIKNSESLVTPADIEARGGTCYYISSINGDDEKNDGKSPSSPFKTIEPLYYYMGAGNFFKFSYLKPGDGVFFERGSEFYPETYHDNTVSTLGTEAGVAYGAYGDPSKPKPAFYCALDFSDSDNVGVWHETEWDNIYVLDEIDEDPEWRGAKSEVGNIYFNGGEGLGVRVVRSGGDDKQHFEEGAKSVDRGYCCNGYEYYYSGKKDMTNPGTALTNNLEFFHDYKEGKLYLYCEDGNPADVFDDIKVPRNGTAAWASGSGAQYDNLAFLYSSYYAVRSDGFDVTYTNCEIGCVGGDLASIESGIEMFGPSDGVYVYNCYIHDVGDGSLTSQSTSTTEGQVNVIQNVQYVGNVMVACGNGAEIWNHMGPLDENGYAQNTIENCLIKDNFMAYIGYGITQKQDTASSAVGNVICGSMYGELSECMVEGNIFYKGNGYVYGSYMATYEQPRGWQSKGNTYIYNSTHMSIGFCYETLNHIDHNMWKRARICFPYTYEGLVWYTGLGIDPTGTYYHYETVSDAESKDCFFMTGYHAEHGGFNK